MSLGKTPPHSNVSQCGQGKGSKGVSLTKYLIRHGANVNYHDHALRNALYWSVYYNCPEIALYLLEAGAEVRPWSWIQEDALPSAFLR